MNDCSCVNIVICLSVVDICWGNNRELLMILCVAFLGERLEHFKYGRIGYKNWDNKSAFLVGICCLFTEVIRFGGNMGSFNKDLLMFIGGFNFN